VKRARGVNAEALLQYRSSVLHAAEDVEDASVYSSNRKIAAMKSFVNR